MEIVNYSSEYVDQSKYGFTFTLKSPRYALRANNICENHLNEKNLLPGFLDYYDNNVTYVIPKEFKEVADELAEDFRELIQVG